MWGFRSSGGGGATGHPADLLLVGADEGWLHQLNQCHFNPPEKQKNNQVLRKDAVK